MVGLVGTAALTLSLSPAATVHAVPSGDRLAIGDSVMLGAQTQLKARGFRVDATVSRQSYSGPALLRAKGSSLPRTVVVHLGTNGSFPLDVCRRIVRNAGPDRQVFLVTVHVPRSWQDSNNAAIRRCDRSFAADRVTVVDWHSAATRNPGWLYRDRVHLTPAGARGFARLIDQAVDSAR
jgi:lysophospholipase L1-like esterase